MNPWLHSRFFALFFFCLCFSTLFLEAQQDEEVIIYVDEGKTYNVHLLRMESYVTDPSSKSTRLVLRDLGGKLVRDLPIEDSGKGIELGVLPTGTYLAILSTENKGYKSFKLVVE